ncbi:alpha-amylase family glycosyl hydrolase [Armatimonas sp.]|uniref:alpha-amylase family glycosyl hydrolase n=1 Tax=Armatimonas sp. TaxID=1872638 RepID=UPI00286B7A40|nr:alpha-amylase family glycosyl hydrolase [Armatimonas sp.]
MTQPGILFQHFYYPTPELPAERSWWKQATAQLSELAALGVWGVWHPVPSKGGSGKNSMGYDPYDYYDLGSKDQRGSVATHFGTRDEYLAYVAAAHTHGLSVIADVVLNHNIGADQAQLSPVQERLGWDDIPDDSKVPRDHLPPGYDPKRDNLRAWSGFNPKGRDGLRGTGRFPRDARHFHPTALHPDHKEPYHHPDFGSDFCFEAENGYVAKSFLAWSEWFVKQSGVDGYRLDAVKLMEPEFLRDFAAATRPGSYLVGELWDTNPKLLADFQSRTERRMKLFDFGLYYALRDMMTNPNFDMRELLTRRFADRERAVMFVSNHDVDRDSPIPRDKRGLPYAVMMAMAGQPSIFHLDYLGLDTRPYSLQHTLRNLTSLYNALCWGKESVLLATKDVLALERESGLIAVFVRPGGPREFVVPTRW